ncbi:unnamed protein product [Linum trigynum]|uniref:Uncharacterized protein n=1 Tax=Linum trigynum TaxID=586398 RepID=A0AAV2CU01_9ROSI
MIVEEDYGSAGIGFRSRLLPSPLNYASPLVERNLVHWVLNRLFGSCGGGLFNRKELAEGTRCCEPGDGTNWHCQEIEQEIHKVIPCFSTQDPLIVFVDYQLHAEASICSRCHRTNESTGNQVKILSMSSGGRLGKSGGECWSTFRRMGFDGSDSIKKKSAEECAQEEKPSASEESVRRRDFDGGILIAVAEILPFCVAGGGSSSSGGGV